MAVGTKQYLVIIDLRIQDLSNCEVYDAGKEQGNPYSSAFSCKDRRFLSCFLLSICYSGAYKTYT